MSNKNKDWTGNSNSVYKIISASNHSDTEREVNDFYATDPIAALALLEVEDLNNIWECACGQGHLAKEFEKVGKLKRASDLINRGFGTVGVDFLKYKKPYNGDIVTNPPYKVALDFTEHALDLISDGRKVAMFLKLTFLESVSRKKFFEKYPPRTVYVFSRRVICAPNGDFEKTKSSAVCYAWFVWEKGFIGKPEIEWL